MDRAIRVSTFLLLGLALLLGVWAAVPKPGRAVVAGSPSPSAEETASETFRPASSPSYDPPSPAGSEHPKTGRYVAAWMPTDWDTPEARTAFEANLDILDEVSPIWYEMRGDGTLMVLGGARDETLIRLAHEADVLVLPCLTNGFDPERTGYTLGNPERRSAFVRRILAEVEEYGYDGIDIDFEAVPETQRDEFTAFIRELAAGLHEKGRLLSVAIHARTGDQ
ncbi:MAG: glycosyl hydrolase family 18 protein, partial [Chloroflexia bacterium]